jgi:hypothetical protein
MLVRVYNYPVMDIERGLCSDSSPLDRRLWRASRLFEAMTATPFENEPQLIKGETSLVYPDTQQIEIGNVPVRKSFREALRKLSHEESHHAHGDRVGTDKNQQRADEEAEKFIGTLSDLSPAKIFGYELRRSPISSEAQTQLMIDEIIYGTGDDQRLREHSRELARIEADDWQLLTPQETIDSYQWELYRRCQGRMSYVAARGPAIELTVDDHRYRREWIKTESNYNPVDEEEFYQEAQDLKQKFQDWLKEQANVGVE